MDEGVVGRVIGRGGERIARLREGCERAEVTPSDGSGQRMLIVSGDVAQITRAVRKVAFLPISSAFIWCPISMICPCR